MQLSSAPLACTVQPYRCQLVAGEVRAPSDATSCCSSSSPFLHTATASQYCTQHQPHHQHRAHSSCPSLICPLALPLRSCWPLQVSERLQLLLALQRVRDDCGFQDIVPAMWLDPVNAVMPGTGYHIQWYALWMELAPGISFEAILRNAAEPQVPRAVMANFLSERMNKSQVARAALFDLLTMQCDRHQQNILVDESGNLHLIDNEVRGCLGCAAADTCLGHGCKLSRAGCTWLVRSLMHVARLMALPAAP